MNHKGHKEKYQELKRRFYSLVVPSMNKIFQNFFFKYTFWKLGITKTSGSASNAISIQILFSRDAIGIISLQKSIFMFLILIKFRASEPASSCQQLVFFSKITLVRTFCATWTATSNIVFRTSASKTINYLRLVFQLLSLLQFLSP